MEKLSETGGNRGRRVVGQTRGAKCTGRPQGFPQDFRNLWTEAKILLLELGWPARPLWKNARVDWRVKAKHTAQIRNEAAWAATARLRELLELRPLWNRAACCILGAYRGTRPPDRSNLVHALEGAFDGLQDAGVIRDDRGLVFPWVEWAGRAKAGRVWLYVSEISTDPATTAFPYQMGKSVPDA